MERSAGRRKPPGRRGGKYLRPLCPGLLPRRLAPTIFARDKGAGPRPAHAPPAGAKTHPVPYATDIVPSGRGEMSMHFLFGSALILLTIVAVSMVAHALNRPGAPVWSRSRALGEAIALGLTMGFATGLSLLLLGMFEAGSWIGVPLAAAGLVLPLLAIPLIGRLTAPRAKVAVAAA